MKTKIQYMLVSLFLLFAATSAHSVEVMDIDIHGFISQGYLQSSDNNFHAPTEDGTFEFNEMGINFSKDVTDRLRMGLQIFSRDLGDNGNNDITLDWAFGDYRFYDSLGVRFGKIKTPQGLYNETRDVDMLRNAIFLPQSVYSEVLRDADLALIGGGVYGNFDLNKFGFLSYQCAMGAQNVDETAALMAALIGTNRGEFLNNVNIDVDRKYSFGLVWDTPLEGMRLGGTWNRTEMEMSALAVPTNGPTGTIDIDYESLETSVVSAEYTWNDLIVMAEYMWSDRNFTINSPTIADEVEFKPDGWYLGATYRFVEWFELGGYYSEYYSDRNDRDGNGYTPNYTGYLKDLCLTARFDINEYWCVKVEGHMFEGTATLTSIDNPVPEDGSEQWTDDWTMVAAKVTFSF